MSEFDDGQKRLPKEATMQTSEQRKEGRKAYRRDVPGKDNPHPAGSSGFWDWNHGWADAQYDETMLTEDGR